MKNTIDTLRNIKRKKIRREMMNFYANPAALKEERSMAEGSFIIHKED
jgi:hypothetical protein